MRCFVKIERGFYLFDEGRKNPLQVKAIKKVGSRWHTGRCRYGKTDRFTPELFRYRTLIDAKKALLKESKGEVRIRPLVKVQRGFIKWISDSGHFAFMFNGKSWLVIMSYRPPSEFFKDVENWLQLHGLGEDFETLSQAVKNLERALEIDPLENVIPVGRP